MKLLKYTTHVTTLLLSGLLSLDALSQSIEPLSFNSEQPLSESKQVSLPALDNQKLRENDLQRASTLSVPEPFIQYAVPRAVSISPEQGTWDSMVSAQSTTGEPMYVWRTTVESAGALSINLGFGRFHMPEGGALYVYTPDRNNVVRPFTAADNDEHGQLWTPILPGDQVVVEVNIPASQVHNLQLELTSVNHGYVGDSVGAILDARIMSGSCNVDVVCPAGDGWRDQIRSVAAYGTGGGRFCTGAAINNTANDGRPFFLTADHCGIDAQNAPSVVVYWNFENSTCRTPGSSSSGGNGNGSLNQFNTGAIFRAGYSPSDMTLFELDDPINSSYNVYLAGWDATTNIPSSAVGIHHPNVDEKRISFENDPLSMDGSTHLRVNDWDLGTTEPGSSGSPLFNQNKRIVGQLTGGSAACGNNGHDVYGWLNVSWNGGGTSDSRVRDWLDAAGTGQLAIDGRNANGGVTPPPPPPPPVNELEKDKPVTGLSGAKDNQAFFTFNVPAGAKNVSVKLSGGSGDADLHVKFGSKPTLSSFDCRPYLNGNNETCSFATAQTGTYHVLVNGYAAYSGATLVATYEAAATGGNSGENLNIAVNSGQWFRHTIQIPANTRTLTVTTSGGSGDADLYVRNGTAPTTGTFTCRSWTETNNETCVIQNPAAGTWHVGVHGYSNSSGIKETWRFE